MNQTTSGDGPAIQVGGNVTGLLAGRDINYTPRNDGYTDMEMGRANTRKALLPDNWLATAAAAASVIGLFINLKVNQTSSSLWLTLLFLLIVAGAVTVPVLRGQLAKTNCVPVFGWVIEPRADGNVDISQAVGTCPRCKNRMHLQRFKEKDQPAQYSWVCASGVTQHALGFDPTEFAKTRDI
ncbi:hypothetical protein [Mycobacteroides abscessus]|uniref:hypothetical protein n=1 Tax=Mycobacteroides abscessus TaxID=36809 RepID=UPI000C260FBF|nr:hypothetical protein [Mycobacteroides abscessus]